jgi:hypothetical protein
MDQSLRWAYITDKINQVVIGQRAWWNVSWNPNSSIDSFAARSLFSVSEADTHNSPEGKSTSRFERISTCETTTTTTREMRWNLLSNHFLHYWLEFESQDSSTRFCSLDSGWRPEFFFDNTPMVQCLQSEIQTVELSSRSRSHRHRLVQILVQSKL